MKPWINDDIFKAWTEAQKRLWESLCSVLPFQPPAALEAWKEVYFKNLATWETAVKQILDKEAGWVEQWVKGIASKNGTPEIMAVWTRQMEEVLQRWVGMQNQWWDDYFAVLRRGGNAGAAVTTATAEPAAEPPITPPAPAPEPVVTVAASEETTVAEPISAPAGEAAPEPVAAAEAPVTVAEAPVTAAEAPVTVAEAPVTVAEAPVTVAEAPVEPAPSAPIEVAAVSAASEQPDDLKTINGIGPALEKKLNACGVFTYRQLAILNDEDIARIEAIIKSAGRIRRDAWIGQAKEQHFQKYQESL